jgi:hypothetical protein
LQKRGNFHSIRWRDLYLGYAISRLLTVDCYGLVGLRVAR